MTIDLKQELAELYPWFYSELVSSFTASEIDVIAYSLRFLFDSELDREYDCAGSFYVTKDITKSIEHRKILEMNYILMSGHTIKLPDGTNAYFSFGYGD